MWVWHLNLFSMTRGKIPFHTFLVCLYESTVRAIAVTMALALVSDVGVGIVFNPCPE